LITLRGFGMRRILFAALSAWISLGQYPSHAMACDARTPCTVDGGEYFVSLPNGWNGRDPAPLVVFFHGYSGSAEDVMSDEPLRRSLSHAGAILVAPQGAVDQRGVHTWSLPGRPKLPRDDFAFVADVMKDVRKRWPIDARRTLASGFSVGGSMVWYIACTTPETFAGYAPVAGAFWAPEPESCKGPVSLRHVHGRADNTVPMAGRTLRGGAMRQGDVMKNFGVLKKEDACPAAPARTDTNGALTCQTWPAASCGAGRELVLCLHPGEHEIEANWVLDGVHWLDGLAAARSAKR
jgi:polyhydroxybutyrate depolymerase